MTCANHPDAEVSAYCRTCGKPLCSACRRDVGGTVFCAEHEPVAEPVGAAASSSFASAAAGASATPPPPPSAGSPYNSGSPYSSSNAAPPPPRGTPYVHDASAAANLPSPALAFILGFIPGVGAIYNGQYAKGLVHAVVFGLIVTIINSGRASGFEPLFGILLAIWIFYMAFEAHHTAAKRRSGHSVDELSSLMNISGSAAGVPLGPVILIGLGILLLMDTLNLISFDRVIRYWPLILIAGGAYMLYVRVRGQVQSNGR